VSYPPSGPQDPRPQDRPSQSPGWQSQAYQPQGYQPGNYAPGGPAAPSYGQPPKKNRAGLVIVLLIVVLVAALGVGGVLAYGLVSDRLESSPEPDPGTSVPAATATPDKSIPAPQPTKTFKPTVKPTIKPTVKPPVKPAGDPADLARRFVAQLNADNADGATDLVCADTRALVPTLLEQFVEPPTKLTSGDSFGDGPTYMVPLSGTTKGRAVKGMLVVQKPAEGPLCVQVFQLTPR
jgi:hypothetical protein